MNRNLKEDENKDVDNDMSLAKKQKTKKENQELKNYLKNQKKRLKFKFNFTFIITAVVFVCFIISAGLTIAIASIIEYSGEAFDNLDILIYLLIAFAFSSVIGTIIASFFSRAISKEVLNINSAVKKVGAGDFSVRIPDSKSRIWGNTIHSLNKMIEELNSVTMLRNDFISNFSHEFKTPIVSIKGFAEVLRDNQNLTQEEQREYLNIIIQESTRLSNLSQNTLLLSKLETQGKFLEKEKFSIDEQIRQIVLLLDKEMSKRSLKVNVKLHKINYVASQSLFYHIWMNILSNAVKYARSYIKVYSTKKESGFTITIEDDGNGMTLETQKHVFDKYYQGENASSIVGNGLGLSIAKKVIELYGGRIFVESEIGKGTKFIVVFNNN